MALTWLVTVINRSVRLHTLAKALSPAYLRFGGTAADFLIFRQNSSSSVNRDHSTNCWIPEDCDGSVMKKNFTNFYMSGLFQIVMYLFLLLLFCCLLGTKAQSMKSSILWAGPSWVNWEGCSREDIQHKIVTWVLSLSSMWLLQSYNKREEWESSSNQIAGIKKFRIVESFLVPAHPDCRGSKTVVVLLLAIC